MALLTRRHFIRSVPPSFAVAGSISLPVAAESVASTAQERADYHWKLFAEAMNELTANQQGWIVMGGERKAFEHAPTASAWSNRKAIVYEVEHDRRFPKPLVIEWHREIGEDA